MNRMRGAGAIVTALARRPGLWPVALVVAARLSPNGWWRRWPPLPWPDDEYWRFRMQTAYGGEGDRPPAAADVVEFLEWCKERRRWHRRPRALR